MSNLAYVNANNIAVIQTAGGISAIVRCLSLNDNEDEVIQSSAARLLWSFSFCSANDAIREDGGIPLLVSLLSAPDAKTRRFATAALTHLAYFNVANRDPIIQAGVIPTLLKLSSDGDWATRWNAAALLSPGGLNVSRRDVEVILGKVLTSRSNGVLDSLTDLALQEDLGECDLFSTTCMIPVLMLLSNANVGLRRSASTRISQFCCDARLTYFLSQPAVTAILEKAKADLDVKVGTNVGNAIRSWADDTEN
jgi:hypothetical protein